MKKTLIFIGIIAFLFVLTELISRNYGLHQFPLFQESSEFEYIHKPNQDTYIYGNHFQTNEYSMRSLPINKNDSLIVLLIGDSVLNGGNTIDQNGLVSTLLEKKLTKKMGRKVRVLNISSYSWGPANNVAFLKKYGLFKSKLIVYICNSADAYDIMTFNKIVGVNNMFPVQNKTLAISKLIEKGFRELGDFTKNKLGIGGEQVKKKYPVNIDHGFFQLDSLATKNNIPLLVYMHPTVAEISEKKYNFKGEKIIFYFNSKNRTIIDGLKSGAKKEFYRDDIHLVPEGHKFMSDQLYNPIIDVIK